MLVLKCIRCDGIQLIKHDDLKEDEALCSNCGIVDIDLECEVTEMSLDEIKAKA